MTSKIHELQQKEQQLQEQLDLNFDRKTLIDHNDSILFSALRADVELFSSLPVATGSPRLQPKSPLKNVVKAFLPDNQKTTVLNFIVFHL